MQCLLIEKRREEEEEMASLSSCWCWLKRVRPLSSLLYNDSMIYLGHYSSLLVLPFLFPFLLFFVLLHPIRREKVAFFFSSSSSSSSLLLSPVGDVNKVLEQECKTWCLVRMLTNEIFFLDSLSTNRVDERKESINRVYNQKHSSFFFFFSFLSRSLALSLSPFSLVLMPIRLTTY